MTALIALAGLFGQGAAPPKEETAAQLLGAAFKHYYDAKTLTGRIHLSETARNYTISIDTDVAYDRPSKMYIFQRRGGNNPGQWLAVSNGAIFSYNKPPDAHGPARFREAVVQPDGRVQTIPEMYAALRRQSLSDYSPILDIAIANEQILNNLKSRWMDIRRAGTGTVRGQTVNIVTGEFCAILGQPPTGNFEIDLTPAGDILRFVRKSRWAVKEQPGQTIDVLDNWEADLHVDGPIDPKVFHE